jgi:hypothetical protein
VFRCRKRCSGRVRGGKSATLRVHMTKDEKALFERRREVNRLRRG